MGRILLMAAFASATASALVDCNPFAAFAECDESGDSEIAPGEVAKGVNVDAQAASVLKTFSGELVWSQTADHSLLTAAWQRTQSPARTETDCDGKFTGIAVPVELRVSSADGLLDSGQLLFTLQLSRQGQISSLDPPSALVFPDFGVLKAAGEVPDAWISGFLPKLELVISRPDLKLEDSNILVDVPTSETESHVVSLASLTFQ